MLVCAPELPPLTIPVDDVGIGDGLGGVAGCPPRLIACLLGLIGIDTAPFV